MPWIKVLLCQAIALGIVLAIGPHLHIPLPVLLMGQGLAAALLGWRLGLSRIWFPLQALLPLAAAYGGVVPAWIYLVAFALCALTSWNSASEQVPLYLTNRRTWAALGDLAVQAGARTVVDLGSGTGGVVLFLARAHPQIEARGLETAPLVYLVSRLRVMASRLRNARILYRSLWDEDLSRYDLVYCFLSPVPMPRLYEKAKAEMRPGTLFVSNSFVVPGQAPGAIVEVGDRRGTKLHVYRM